MGPTRAPPDVVDVGRDVARSVVDEQFGEAVGGRDVGFPDAGFAVDAHADGHPALRAR